MKKSLDLWGWCCVVVIVIAILTFTPLITPAGVDDPWFFGMPYTMWMGILQTVVLLLLTYLGTRVHPGFKDHEEG